MGSVGGGGEDLWGQGGISGNAVVVGSGPVEPIDEVGGAFDEDAAVGESREIHFDVISVEGDFGC